jgi:crossover junction endodeoxyribonuclease RusA
VSHEIYVRGIPAPQGSKRHIGNGRMIEQSKAVGPWRDAVRSETAKVIDAPLTGPVDVYLQFSVARPAGHYGTGKNKDKIKPSAPTYPGARPDLDKLCRAVLDGLTEGGAWRDDGQVVFLQAQKFYGQPGCLITVEASE